MEHWAKMGQYCCIEIAQDKIFCSVPCHILRHLSLTDSIIDLIFSYFC